MIAFSVRNVLRTLYNIIARGQAQTKVYLSDQLERAQSKGTQVIDINMFSKTEARANASNLAVALQFAEAGFAVFPANPRNKAPLVEGWQDKATTNRATIRKWWGRWPNAAPALPTGERNGIAVLDLDCKSDKDGDSALAELGIDAKSRIVVTTPSGGKHLYFEYEHGLRNTGGKTPAGEHAPGVDVRAEGGYVLAPGASIAAGDYRYQTRTTLLNDVIGLPSWPTALMPAQRSSAHRGADHFPSLSLNASREILDELPGWWAEERDQWRNTGMALKHEYGDEGLELWDEWSQQSHKYERRDLIAQWRSFKDRANPITMASLIAEAPVWQEKRRDREWQETWDALPDEFDDLPPRDSSVAAKRGALTFTTPDQIEEIENRPYIIKGLIAERDIASIVGAPGVGKSLLAPRLAFAVAQGQSIFGKRVKQGGVFYVAAEDEHGMRNRVRVLRKRLGKAENFQIVGGVSDLLSKDSLNLRELRKAVEHHRPALVVIDTLAMAFPGLEENSAEGMGRVVAVARSLTKWGAAVILIHHDTKDGQQGLPRGHSLLNGALDVSLHLTRADSGIVRGKLTKNRNGSCDLDLAYRIAVHQLGVDADGEDIEAPYAEELDPALIQTRLPVLTRAERQMMVVFDDIAPNGSTSKGAWIDACISDERIFKSEKLENRKRQFRRELKSIADKGRITVRDDGTVILIANPTFKPEGL